MQHDQTSLFFIASSYAGICFLLFYVDELTKRIKRLERAVKELNPGLDI